MVHDLFMSDMHPEDPQRDSRNPDNWDRGLPTETLIERVGGQLREEHDGDELTIIVQTRSRPGDDPDGVAAKHGTHTPAGFDPRWVEAINDTLADRSSAVRISDLDDDVWSRFLGPLVDYFEHGEDA